MNFKKVIPDQVITYIRMVGNIMYINKRKDYMSHKKEMEHPKKVKAKFLRKISKSANILMTMLG